MRKSMTPSPAVAKLPSEPYLSLACAIAISPAKKVDGIGDDAALSSAGSVSTRLAGSSTIFSRRTLHRIDQRRALARRVDDIARSGSTPRSTSCASAMRVRSPCSREDRPRPRACHCRDDAAIGRRGRACRCRASAAACPSCGRSGEHGKAGMARLRTAGSGWIML